MKQFSITLLLLLSVVSGWGFFRVEPIVTVEVHEIHVTFTIPEGSHQSMDPELFYLKAEPLEGVTFLPTIYPEATEEFAGEPAFIGTITLIKPFEYTSSHPDEIAASITFGHQFCMDTNACLPPETYELEVMLPAMASAASQSNVLYFMLLALIGGLILNVMPCVLPVLSIKALSLVSHSSSRREMRLSALSYTVGVILSFIILAVVIILLKASGELVGWGFQFQNPPFVIVLTVIIMLFALSLFDVFLIRAPGMNTAVRHGSKGGLSGSFFSGVFAVLLATPCTAPLLGVALGFAFSQPAPVIILLFSSVGLGLALPFLLIGFIPGASRLLPKPGEWMNTFKELMGFLLIFTVAYLLRSLFFLVGGINLIRVIFFLVFVSFAAWLYGRFTRPTVSTRIQWAGTILALIVIVGSALWLLRFEDSGYAAEPHGNMQAQTRWEEFSEATLQRYRDAGEPVFLAFTAEWCLTCKTNETTVLHSASIERFFAENKIHLLIGDYTRRDPLISQWLREYKRAGVPLYLYFSPSSKTPLVLPELLSKEMVLSLPVQL